MKQVSRKTEFFAVFKYAGAFIAWMIGSGFATGQEILQFFSSYGIKSIFVLAVNFIGFTALGLILVLNGFDYKDNVKFDHYSHYCGKAVGNVYYYMVPVSLIMIISVLFSASGATLNQYYSVNRYVGSSVMAALILVVYLIGFERMVKIVSAVSPLVIIFTVLVGGITVIRDVDKLGEIANQGAALAGNQAAFHWSLSAVLYLSLNFLTGSIYYTELGRSAVSRRSVKYGAIIGAVVLIITIGIMTFAILLNGKAIAEISVPTLFLADRISGVFGSVFSVVLLLGMFSSCSTMVWSFCSRYYRYDKKKNSIISIVTVAGCLALGFVPFGKLVSVLYPVIGYLGLFFVGGVVIRPIRNAIIRKKQKLNRK